MSTKALILAAVQTDLQDTAEATWTAAALTLYMTEGETDLAQRLRLLQTTASLTASATTPVTAFWTLPTDLVHLDAVRYRGEILTEKPKEYFNWRDWDTETADEPVYWTRFSLTEIRVWPYAVAPYTAGYLTCDYARLPLATMGTSPEIPAQYHRAIEYFAVARALERDDRVEDAASWMRRYELEVAKYRTTLPSPPAYVPYRGV